MAQLHVVGVRHHSPACARLVRHVIGRVRPRFVLIEGPSDMNGRMGELMLGHELPIAIFSYAHGPLCRSTSWSPLCAYSPEWVALEEAARVRAEPLFIDLPAWDSAFSEVQNRYSTRHERASQRMIALCERLGVTDTDSLWDHLFEQPLEPDALALRLSTYFRELREGEDPGDRDRTREAYMSRWIAWALAQGEGDVVVVCGGYHEPELLRGHYAVTDPSKPEVPTLGDDIRTGSYLVPYSFHRLDSFVGYEAGMPSPEFYQQVWERGAAAGEEMLFSTIQHLRAKKQRVSPADAIAALGMARGISSLRGHAELARGDVLDGLAAAVVKDALDAPLPWNHRGQLRRGTDPMLVEMVRSFRGTKVGKLAPSTPRPPLVADVAAELERVGIELEPKAKKITARLAEPSGLERSRVLHRLRLIGVPGFTLTRAPAFTRDGTELSEDWSVVSTLATEAAVIEASALGATLEGAASATLEARLHEAPGLAVLARTLREAALVGIDAITTRVVDDVRRVAGTEPVFTELGAALADLLALYRHDVLLGAAGAPVVGSAIEAAFDRGLWLYEGLDAGALDGGSRRAVVAGALALRDAQKHTGAKLALDGARAEAVMRRSLAHVDAPPAVRGAAMGYLWSLHVDIDETKAGAAVKSAGRPELLGDFLEGVFALAREEVLHAPSLLEVINGLVAPMTPDDFLVAIPSLRLAFAYFPPREKEVIARRVLALHGSDTGDARSLLKLEVAPALTIHGRRLDVEIVRRARRYGLADEADE